MKLYDIHRFFNRSEVEAMNRNDFKAMSFLYADNTEIQYYKIEFLTWRRYSMPHFGFIKVRNKEYIGLTRCVSGNPTIIFLEDPFSKEYNVVIKNHFHEILWRKICS